MKQLEVVAGIIVREGRVFAARRGPGGETGGLWEFPGGKIEAGESPAEALRRELREELGVDTAVGEEIITIDHRYTAFSLRLRCLAAELRGGRMELREHTEGRWLSPAELDEPDWAPADLPAVAAVRRLLERTMP